MNTDLVFYFISHLLVSLTSISLGMLVLLKNKKNSMARMFFLFTLSVSLWSFSYSIWLLCSDYSAALFWAGTTALSYLSESKATYFSIETPDDRIIAILQPNYHLVIITKAGKPETDLEPIIPQLQSIAVRIEILMSANDLVPTETTLDKIVKAIPEIQQAMILTTEGLPVEAVGFENNIEIAALAGSIFANGLTFSQVTESVTITAEGIAILVNRIDQQRILIVSFRGSQALDSCKRVKNLLREEDTS